MRYPPPAPGQYRGKGKSKTIYTVLAVFTDRPMIATFVKERVYIVWKDNGTQIIPRCDRLLIIRDYIDFKRPVANS